MEGKDIRGILGSAERLGATFAILAAKRPWFTLAATFFIGSIVAVAGTLMFVAYFGDKATINALNKQIEHERRIAEIEKRLADCENDRRMLWQAVGHQLKQEGQGQ